MYYLQSRYYNPVIGRFLNSDAIDYLVFPGKTAENHLFAYCGNNPANDGDADGNLSFNKIKNVVSSFFNSIFKAAIEELTNLFKLKKGYLEIKNSVVAAAIDGFIMVCSGLLAFGLKAAVKIIVRDFLLKKTAKSKEFIRFLISKLLTPGILGAVMAALGIVFSGRSIK